MDPLLQAAQCALDIPLRYLQSGSNMAIAALAGAKQFEYLQHYPARDVIDNAHNTRFFYHGHSCKNAVRDEHGHFHLFVYFPDCRTTPTEEVKFSHLVGLSLDNKGQALRWFTTNRWVTGETWHPANQLIALLPAVRLTTKGRLHPVAKWLESMLILFRPQIASLLLERDALIEREIELLKQSSSKNQKYSQYQQVIFENREFDVISECPASLQDQLQEIMSGRLR